MGATLDILVHGRGNAWPVPLGEEHPFYNREDPRDLSNASFSLQLRAREELQSSVLIDAGHGTVQSLLSGDNRIPDCIYLTHGHLDHTLSVDWVVQSFWRKHRKERRYPIYATLPVYRFMIQSYPHLADLTEHRELEFGEAISPLEDLPLKLTPFPAYHGPGAKGASMLLFEYKGHNVLFTGDVLVPMLRNKDYERLVEADLVVADCNNRFPWPRTNHWSFAGSPAESMKRSDILESFAIELEWKQVASPHLQEGISSRNREYLSQLEQEWRSAQSPLTIMEFMDQIRPKKLMLVHYSGAEDRKYNGEEILSARELHSWASDTLRQSGIPGEIVVPETGQRMQII
jgi:glyoxylase-like metal-dependent hydrolase (beta-lactamase superfamily II)